MKHTKNIIMALAAVLIVSALVWASGPLTNTPAYVVPQSVIQQHAPTGTFYKALGTGGQATYANVSTSSIASIDPIAYTGGPAVPVPIAVKFRIGGFATGRENDFQILPSTGGKVWVGNGVTKVGFKAISTATNAFISGSKM